MRNNDHTHPVIRFWCSCIAVSPDVVIFVVRISGPAQVEPPVTVTGVIRNEIHDQIQPCGKQRGDHARPSGEKQNNMRGSTVTSDLCRYTPLLCISARSSSKSCMVP